MRVAIVYDCFFPDSTGGGERVYRAIAEELARRGHQVDYITRELATEVNDLSANIRIVPVWRGELYGADGQRRIGPALRFASAAASHLRRTRRDYGLVIASALPVLTLLASRIALLGTGTRVVGDWLEVWGWRKWLEYSGAVAGTIAWLLQGLGVRITRHHTANSAFTASRLRRYGVREPIVLGLVDLVGELRPHRISAAEPPYVLAVGRHIDDKQLDRIPAAIAMLRASGHEVRAVIAGSGPRTAAIREAVEKHGVGDAVSLVGRVSSDELDALYAEAVALLLPSRREGFGLVVAEAAAHGVPSIVVDAPDNAAVELIDPGRNGVVANSADSGDLAAAIRRVLDAGDSLRRSTAEWFEEARVDRGLERSVTEIVTRWGRTSA